MLPDVRIRKHQHVGRSCEVAKREALRHLGEVDRGVGLHFTVDFEIGAPCTDQFDRALYLLHTRVMAVLAKV